MVLFFNSVAPPRIIEQIKTQFVLIPTTPSGHHHHSEATFKFQILAGFQQVQGKSTDRNMTVWRLEFLS